MSAPAPDRASRARVRAYAREDDRSRGSFDTITDALERQVGPGRSAGSWTRYCCPAHEGDGRRHNPSLGVKYDDAQQRTVVRCFAGCDNELVLDTLGLGVRDLFDRRPERSAGPGAAPSPRPRRLSLADQAIDAAGLPLTQPKKDLGEQVSPWRQTAVYPYAREDGTVAGEVIREEARFEKGRDKKFHQRAWNPKGGWEDTGFDKVPFQLPLVLEGIRDGRTVYVCEGEKDALEGQRAGLIATTNAGGAAAWAPEHAAWLRGVHTVVIVADHDPAGYRRAERVMASLVGIAARVRVVQAATGKDLADHLAAGHEIGELEPVAHLDPFTPTGPAPASEIPTAAVDIDATASSAPPEGPDMSLAYGANAHVHTPSPGNEEVDHVGRGWSQFTQLLMQYLIAAARRHVEASRQAAERAQARSDEEKARVEAERAAKQAAAEARLRALREKGYEHATRGEIAQAVADAVAYAPDSEVARKALPALKVHIQDRFSITVDAVTGAVASEAATSPRLASALADADGERAAADRARKAQDHMVALVASQDLDQSVKEELYAEIEMWRTNPTAGRLSKLTAALSDKGVGGETVTKIRFVASYLGVPGQEANAAERAAYPAVTAVSPTTELRKLPASLVDPGEEAKPGIDKLFAAYQDRLKVGNKRMTGEVRDQLTAAIAVLAPEDQALARARGNDIRKNPAGRFPALWPEHVDRDELGASVRAYALLAPQAEAAAVKAGAIDDATAAAMSKQAERHRKAITHAITHGKGLHQLERDQLTAVLRDVDAGKTTTPDVLFADDRSGAAHDAERADRVAHEAARAHRHKVEQLLDTNAVPRGTTRRTRDDLSRVMDGQAAMAAGRASLSDYERTGVAQKFDARLGAAGVSQPMRNRVSAYLLTAAGEAASLGKQAQRMTDRWEERREAVEAARAPQTPAYDSDERRATLQANLEAAGLDKDQVAQRMAADSGRAKPLATAVKRAPNPARVTQPGLGVNRAYGRSKNPGRDDNDLGR